MKLRLLFLIPFLAACNNSQLEPGEITVDDVGLADPGRFTVSQCATIHLDSRTRSIILIKDNSTGREYLGITGVGVSQIITETTSTSTKDVEE